MFRRQTSYSGQTRFLFLELEEWHPFLNNVLFLFLENTLSCADFPADWTGLLDEITATQGLQRS